VPLLNSVRHRRGWLTPLLFLAVSLALSACGGADSAPDAEPAAEGSAASFPVSVQSGPMQGGEPVTIEARPRSIVSLSPTATEMLWAIGAADQVVAVDDQSDYPAGVPTTELSGYEPNVEAILGYEPDLVVSSGDSGDLVASLDKVEVPVLLLPSAADLEESYSQIERLGAATGHVPEAAEVVAEMRAGIEKALADTPDVEGTTYFHELGPDLFTVSASTFIGEVYRLFDLTNIADKAGSGDDYPQLSSEYVVSADPDLVFVADNECCGVTPGEVRARPGWQRMSAVRDGGIHVVDEDITSRWGPRVVDFVELVGTIVAEHQRVRPAA
jgi:iron complex transport system substrate-binding protein